MKCSKCGSENVNVQAVSITKDKHRGCLYWIFIGWWLDPILWLIFTIPMIFIAIFMPKRKKSVVKGYAVCQSCGKKWKA